MQDVDGKATVKAIPLTQIHDPTSYEERQRIQTAGGVVTEGRVQGILQVSRSIGDGRFKGVGVVNTPFIIKTSISSSCPFAIVACDGLWDMFSPQDAVDFAHNVLVAQNKPITAEEAEKVARAVCVSLVNEAVKRGSQDNVTVVLIIFNV